MMSDFQLKCLREQMKARIEEFQTSSDWRVKGVMPESTRFMILGYRWALEDLEKAANLTVDNSNAIKL